MRLHTWLLNTTEHLLLRRFEAGHDAGLLAALQRLIDSDLSHFQQALATYLHGRPWTLNRSLLQRLITSGLSKAIPPDWAPPLLLLDLEVHPGADAIWEAAWLPTYGLVHAGALQSHLIANPLGFPSRVTDADRSKTLQPDQIPSLLAAQPGILVGHNLRRFDLPLLQRHNPALKGRPLLDTLELDLLAHPQATSHALGGTHRAGADVQANWERLLALDATLMELSNADVSLIAHYGRHEEGFAAYCRSLFVRRGESPAMPPPLRLWFPAVQQSLNQDPLPPMPAWLSAKTEAMWQAAEAIESNAARGIEAMDLPRPTTPQELVGLVAWLGQERNRLLVVPESQLNLLRSVACYLPLRLEPGRTRYMPVARVLAALEHGESQTGLLAPLLLRWLATSPTGRLDELHLFLRNDPALLSLVGTGLNPHLPPPDPIDALFLDRRRRALSEGVITDWAGWTEAGLPPALILKAHLADEEIGHLSQLGTDWENGWALAAAEPSLAPLVKGLSETLIAFVAERSLHLFADRQIRQRYRLRQSDRAALTPIVELLEALQELAPLADLHPTALLLFLRDVEQAIRILGGPDDEGAYADQIELMRQDTAEPWRFRVRRVPLSAQPYLSSQGCLAVTEGMDALDRGRFATQRWGRRPLPLNVTLPALTPVAVHNGPLTPVPRSLAPFALQAVGALAQSAAAGEQSYLLAGGALRATLHQQLAHRTGLHSYAGEHYGSRAKTLERLSERVDSLCLVDHPGALRTLRPDLGRFSQAILEQIPFPDRESAAYQQAEQELLATKVHPFPNLFLPLTAIRLGERVAALQDRAERLSIWDNRLANRPTFRAYFRRLLDVGREEPLLTGDAIPSRAEKALPALLAGLGLTQEQAYGQLDLAPFLRRLVGPEATFRPGQLESIRSILQGKNTLTVLPTGSGKTVCFLVPALVLAEAEEGLTVVISPLQSLMRDHAGRLRRRGLAGVSVIDGNLSASERAAELLALRGGYTWLLFLAPEQLRNRRLWDALLERGVRFLAVDEAHCLSQWGHEFRPEYSLIEKLIEAHQNERREAPIIGCYTATATPQVIAELGAILGVEAPAIAPAERPNLQFQVKRIDLPEDAAKEQVHQAKLAAIRAELTGKTGTALIYCSTRAQTEQVAAELRASPPAGWDPARIGAYHAKIDDRAAIEERFLGGANRPDRLDLLVATVALGMGVDKPDIDLVIHVGLPPSLENYYQEAGRAARDPKRTGTCTLLYHPSDLEILARLAETEGVESVQAVWEEVLAAADEKGACALSPADLAVRLNMSEVAARVALRELEKAGLLKLGFYAPQRVTLVPTGQAKARLDLFQEAILQRLPPAGKVIDPYKFAKNFLKDEPDWAHLGRDAVEAELFSLRTLGALKVIQSTHLALLPDAAGALAALAARSLHLQGLLQALLRTPGVAEGKRVRLNTTGLEQIAASLELPQATVVTDLAFLARLGQAELSEGAFQLAVRVRDHRAPERLAAILQEDGDWLGAHLNGSNPAALHLDLDRERIQRLELLGVARLEGSIPPRAIMIEVKEPTVLTVYDRFDKTGWMERQRQKHLRRAAVQRYAESYQSPTQAAAMLRTYFADGPEGLGAALLAPVLADLNPAQRTAATAPHGHLLIDAAAGTGKTKTVGARIAYLQAVLGIPPERILAVTFSRAGRDQIAQGVKAVRQRTGPSVGPVLVLTLHGMALRILQMAAGTGATWLPARFKIVSESIFKDASGYRRKTNALLWSHRAELFDDLNDGLTWDDQLIYYGAALDLLRNGDPKRGVVLSSADLNPRGTVEVMNHFGEIIALRAAAVKQVFARYEALLHEKEMIDFAGMVVEAIRALQQDPHLGRRLRGRLDAIVIDEFQDTSQAQEHLVRLLAGKVAAINAVGDSDQTIFTFNGSSVENILRFVERNRQELSQETLVVRLEENYRSTPAILDLAAKVISTNRKRTPKVIRPASSGLPGRRGRWATANLAPTLWATRSLAEGAQRIVSEIGRLVSQEGIAPREIAVLYRKDSESYPQGRRVAELLERTPIPVQYRPEAVSDLLLRELFKVQREHRDSSLEALATTEALPSQLRPVVQEYLDAGYLSLSELIEDLRQEREANRSRGAVQLMTIHQAKGLEFRVVFLLYLAPKEFPDYRAAKQDLEEERRLLYVGITRAEERLYLVGQKGSGRGDFFSEVERALQPK